jgi:hypothetical protein
MLGWSHTISPWPAGCKFDNILAAKIADCAGFADSAGS